MDKKLIEEFDRKQKSLKHKKKRNDNRSVHGHKSKQSKRDDPDDFTHIDSSYRDRAQERREGLNKDFDLDPDDIKLLSAGTAPHNDGDISEDLDERRRQEIEESKYLGGDVEHTHLVKGLDFALLEKVKNDQKQADKAAEERSKAGYIFGSADSDVEEEEFITEAILAASATTKNRQLVDIDKIKKGQSTELIPCRTSMARRILNALQDKWPEKSDLFLPGRMTYTISLSEDDDSSTVVTIMKSKAESLDRDENPATNETNFALDQLIGILSRLGRKAYNQDSQKKTRTWDDNDLLDDYRY